MRGLTESEHDRLFCDESALEESSIPIYVDPELEAMEGFRLDGEAQGWVPGRRRIVIHAAALDASAEELRALVAHELAHHQRHHVLISKLCQLVGALAVLSLLVAVLVVTVLTRDLWALGLIPVFIGGLLPTLMMWSSWCSRRMEIDADRRAARLVGIDAYRASLVGPDEPEASPSGLHDWFWWLCCPWPSESERLAALESIDDN